MRILVCEREGATALLIRGELESCGHEVLSAQDEAEALAHIRTVRLELVILDADGIGLSPLSALRQAPWSENVPVVVLTPGPEDSAVFEAYHAGADMVLTKPFNPRELVTFRPRD